MDDLSFSFSHGEFAEPTAEATFLKDVQPRLTHQMQLVATLQSLLYLSAIGLNWRDFGHAYPFAILTSMRLGVAVLLAGAILLSRSSKPFLTAQRLYLAGGFLTMATELIEYHFLAKVNGSSDVEQTPFILVIVLMTWVAAPIPMWMTIASTLFGSFLFLGYQMIVSGPGATVTLKLLIFFLLANGVGYCVRVVYNRIIRRDFVLRQELERAEHKARQADAAKGRFLAVMSHEIRTPLNGVLGCAQLLQETMVLPEQRQLLDILARSGNQLSMLLDDVLDLARIEAGRLDLVQEAFRPSELLASVQAVLYPQARSKGLALRLEHPAGPLPVLEGDVLRLQQVLINLAGNAVKFSEQGEVVITLELSEVADQPELRLCVFSVRDTGPGLGEDTQTRIFAPFEQGDMSLRRQHGGAGLGLAISRELVAAMGGELTLESAKGQGSVFRFALNLPVGKVRKTAVMQPGCSLSVLVVDDQEANLIVAKGLLVSLGHRVRTATNGARALEVLQAERFDAVLLDLHMHEMDGPEVFHSIRQLPDARGENLPVFLVTADTERSRIQACLAEGMQGVLPKPIRKAKLAELLMGIPALEEPNVMNEISLVDASHVMPILADLGSDVWKAGVEACRTSAQVCLEELNDPGQVPKALHRLAGLSASYGLARLHQCVRLAESQVAAGEPCPVDAMRKLVVSSLDRLESVTLQSIENT